MDGVDRGSRALCEVFARIGALKPGQRHKLATDMLKLLTVEHHLVAKGRPEKWRKSICVTDKPIADWLLGSSWHAGVVKEFGFQVFLVPLDDNTRKQLSEAIVRQGEGMRLNGRGDFNASSK